MKKILPPTLFIIIIATMLVLHFTCPFKQLISNHWRWGGVVLMVLGIALSTFGSTKFNKVGTTVMTFDEPDLLVTDGIYQLTRNPMYLGFAIAIVGVWILLGSVSSLLVCISFVLITDLWYIRFEEKMLIKKFGQKYEAYQAKVRRWL